MTVIANVMHPPLAQPASAGHPADIAWQQAMAQLAAALAQRGVHPSRAVVLLPYAQLMQQARAAWLAQAGSAGAEVCLVPRFETTMNWSASLGGTLGVFEPSGDDLRLDVACDVLTAASLLARAGLAEHQDALAGRLVEAAWAIAKLAAAVPPEQRPAWGARLAAGLGAGLEAPVLALEAALGRLALAWAANSSYPSDRLFSAPAELLVVLEGFQAEPLTEALKTRFGERAFSIPLNLPADAGVPALHAAQDAEDEAQRAAACVLAHLAQGRSPVALIAQDRVLTRRIRAMLDERGVALRDETGWKLSTTRAAASLMSLLRAQPWDASTDAVLDWLKNAPAFEASGVTALEVALRKAGVRQWRSLPAPPEAWQASSALIGQVQALRDALQRARPLAAWLRDLRAALQSAGQWEALMQDAAGMAVLDVLRLHEGAEAEFADQLPRMGLRDVTSWVNQVLESVSFTPRHPSQAQVVILPLSQLLGRPMQAVVLPGCDEIRLPVSPEPAGLWTPGQRELLGLPSRQELSLVARAAWRYALQLPRVDVLWRTSEGGERLMPSGFVQELLLLQTPVLSPDPRRPREVAVQPTPAPMPTGQVLPVERLSASAYEDLRRCPYRFFALRQLKLQESDELDGELGKRDFGNWLHSLLRHFHEQLKATPAGDLPAQTAMINIAAQQAARELGLSDSEFLPFAAAWPRVREGYLQWLAEHEATGARFAQAEVAKTMPLGPLTLVGRIDRMDQQADGSTLVMDYKTEARTTTNERIKQGAEDTQLAFYAALLHDDTLAAAYVNLGEKEPTRSFAQPDIVELRDELIGGILSDMGRIAQGAPLPALGEGKACDFCAARGLCRKDFREGA